ncbi:excalibur calcium-binding domain-containing protein [Sphingomonas sp. KR3-1]|uniref:excalibur calcium-binding domain-containing protein n=1 Tax=Sphingomonas sp. KR3-1 TaxID=3156611 RepID=UPI0032B3D7F2
MRTISAKRLTAMLAAAGMLAAGFAEAAPDGGRGKKRRAKTVRTVRVTRAPRMVAADDAYYPNCAAARAAGVAPIRRGQPGYSGRLDRDDDGIACE